MPEVASYGRECWPVKGDHVINLERDDGRRVRWIYNIRQDNKIPSVELRNRLQLIT